MVITQKCISTKNKTNKYFLRDLRISETSKLPAILR